MENKSNKGLIFVIIILIIMVLGLGGYIVYDKFIDVDPKSNIKEENKKKEEKEEKSIIKDKDKKIVYTEGDYEYKKVPVININSDDADALNKEIKEYVEKMGASSDYGEGFSLSYDYYENDNILSVRLKITTIGSPRYYKTVNIDSKTGKKLTNYDLIKYKNIDGNEIGKTVFNIYVKDAENNDSLETAKTQRVYNDEFTSVYEANERGLTNKKYNEFDMYLNSKGELCVIAEVYLIAGPEKNFYIYNLNTKTIEK